MKTVRVTYTILHTFQAPDDWDDVDIKFAVEGFAENGGFFSMCNDIEFDVVDKNGTIRSLTMTD